MAKNNIVLFEPEIPQNSGNIMRTCAGTDTHLHFIKPLGFLLDDAHLKRSAVNYLPNVHFSVYENWEDFLSKNQGKMYFLTRYGMKTPHALELSDPNETYYFVIGKESTGIPKEILKDHLDKCYRIPMIEGVRSLNLSNCVAIVVYEILRQRDYEGLSGVETIKGEDYLEIC